MKRFNFYMSNVELSQLKTISFLSGVSVSELIRRAIDSYIENEFLKRREFDLTKIENVTA